MSTFLLMLLSAIKSVINYCTSATWSPVVESVPAFKQDITALNDKVKAIDDLIKKQSAKITGYTAIRRTLRTTLEQVSLTQISRGMAYAKKADKVLFDTLAQGKTMTDIERMKLGVLGQKMGACHDALAAVPIASLTPFGITTASLQNWVDAIKAYNDFLSTPRTKMVDRKAMTKALKESITDANDFLRTEVMFHARGFANSNKDFFNGFEDALRQIPISDRHTRLVATLTDENGNVFPYCQVSVDSFTDKNKTYKAYFGYTDSNGQCILSGFRPGVRSVTVSGDTIETKTFSNINFVRAKAVERKFICIHAFTNIPAPQSNKEKVK